VVGELLESQEVASDRARRLPGGGPGRCHVSSSTRSGGGFAADRRATPARHGSIVPARGDGRWRRAAPAPSLCIELQEWRSQVGVLWDFQPHQRA
jgi:hypothetical protein